MLRSLLVASFTLSHVITWRDLNAPTFDVSRRSRFRCNDEKKSTRTDELNSRGEWCVVTDDVSSGSSSCDGFNGPTGLLDIASVALCFTPAM